MKLKCHLKDMKCPRYFHQGPFLADNQTLKQFQSDLQQCANCMAYEPPRLPDFRDDLIQIGAITLLEKGPQYQADHESGASFGSFIRPYICGSLRDARRKELKQCKCYFSLNSEKQRGNQEENTDIGLLWDIPDKHAEFEDELISGLQLSEFESRLPEMLPRLTSREHQVFKLLRAGIQPRDIAKMLSLSQARISQISKKVVQKLNRGCQEFGIIEGAGLTLPAPGND